MHGYKCYKIQVESICQRCLNNISNYSIMVSGYTALDWPDRYTNYQSILEGWSFVHEPCSAPPMFCETSIKYHTHKTNRYRYSHARHYNIFQEVRVIPNSLTKRAKKILCPLFFSNLLQFLINMRSHMYILLIYQSLQDQLQLNNTLVWQCTQKSRYGTKVNCAWSRSTNLFSSYHIN